MCNTGIEFKIYNIGKENNNIFKNITIINNIENATIIDKKKNNDEYNDKYKNKASQWAFSMNFPKDFPIF